VPGYGLDLFEVQRSHFELFGRSMEARGLVASIVARRLSDAMMSTPRSIGRGEAW